MVSAPGDKQANSTKTGLISEVSVHNCIVPVIQSLVADNGRVFISRVCYNQKTLVTCHSFLNLLGNETFDDVVSKKDFPVAIRPVFARFLSSMWDYVRNTTQFVCQSAFGAVIPIGGLIIRLPAPAILGVMLLTTTTFDFIMDFPVCEVAAYAIPFFSAGFDFLPSVFPDIGLRNG